MGRFGTGLKVLHKGSTKVWQQIGIGKLVESIQAAIKGQIVSDIPESRRRHAHVQAYLPIPPLLGQFVIKKALGIVTVAFHGLFGLHG